MMILVYCRGNNDNDDDCIDLIDDRVGGGIDFDRDGCPT
jgi:hypothetical protein